jgi:hypothetical protein
LLFEDDARDLAALYELFNRVAEADRPIADERSSIGAPGGRPSLQ